jgi:hypothetical protein
VFVEETLAAGASVPHLAFHPCLTSLLLWPVVQTSVADAPVLFYAPDHGSRPKGWRFSIRKNRELKSGKERALNDAPGTYKLGLTIRARRFRQSIEEIPRQSGIDYPKVI